MTSPFVDTETHCKTHGVLLCEERVLVRYGLYRFSGQFMEAHRTLFPESRFMILGGCMGRGSLVANVMYCGACRAAHVAWCKEHGSSEGLPPTKAELEWILARNFGDLHLTCSLTLEARTLLDQGKEFAAVIALKKANPMIEVAALRAHVRFLLSQDDVEKVRNLPVRDTDRPLGA